MLVLAVFAIYAFRSIFSSLTIAYDVETSLPDSELKINEDNLNKAQKGVFEKEIVPLEFK